MSRGAGILAGIVFASTGFMMMWTNEISDDEPTMEFASDQRTRCEIDGTGLRGVEIEVAET